MKMISNLVVEYSFSMNRKSTNLYNRPKNKKRMKLADQSRQMYGHTNQTSTANRDGKDMQQNQSQNCFSMLHETIALAT